MWEPSFSVRGAHFATLSQKWKWRPRCPSAPLWCLRLAAPAPRHPSPSQQPLQPPRAALPGWAPRGNQRPAPARSAAGGWSTGAEPLSANNEAPHIKRSAPKARSVPTYHKPHLLRQTSNNARFPHFWGTRIHQRYISLEAIVGDLVLWSDGGHLPKSPVFVSSAFRILTICPYCAMRGPKLR